ncbi:DegT/DnrJ/EryC1/StrS family aminotransferase [Massilia horti]|uniref:Aminotransferase DegT n=1 Tax=Massilia horti TaxID=2562153 RepID=A0A4Y9T2N7_9BURK|nr:DegT/DnrJ/EryC1/StrS family aminotransferase [Massilia horti]TFW33392.1 aminotransferase DegT [Massilia horti]
MPFLVHHALPPGMRELIESRAPIRDNAGICTSGAGLPELEARLAGRTGARHCIATRSGADAVALALMAAGLGKGHEVITSPFASGATVAALVRRGARPVFADIDRATCNIDAAQIEALITPRTRAIVPVSLYGQPADMEEINAIARRHQLLVLEDALESFGATYHRKQSGNLSAVGYTSLLPEASLGWHGDLGAVFTSDDALADAMRLRRDAGAPMMDQQLSAVFDLLDRFDTALQRRMRVAASYEALFSGRLPRVGRQRDRGCAFSYYALLLEERARLRAALDDLGIATTIHPLPLHLQRDYAFLGAAERCPVATQLAALVLCLPIDSSMDELQATRVAEAVLRVAGVPMPYA